MPLLALFTSIDDRQQSLIRAPGMALRLLRSTSLRKRMADRARAALSVVKSFSVAGTSCSS